MSFKLYISNLSYQTNEGDLRAAVEPFGTVTEIFIATDRDTGKPRGFAFVTVDTAEQGQAAIAGLNGTEVDGRKLLVSEAKPRPDVATSARPKNPNFGPDRRAGAFHARNHHRR